MQDAFVWVLVVVLAGAVIAAAWAGIASRAPYDQIGRGGLFEEDPRARPDVASAAGAAEREEEIRQMLQARSARRVARGGAPLDVDAELAALLAQARPVVADPSLIAEVRQLVEARNARRVRAGKEPLDVDEEVARQLRELT
jgi:glutamate 5-kinase